MKEIRDAYKKTGRLYHAYGLLGERESLIKELCTFLEKDLEFPLSDNPDFWRGDYTVFKIADSHAVNQAHLNRPVRHERKVFVIAADAITKDAQNSLLKIFEEPRADTVFFLIMPETANLLPTLESRIIFVREEKGQGESTAVAEKFLRSGVGERLRTAEKMNKELKDGQITKAQIVSFLKDLEKVLRDKKPRDLPKIETLEKAISYMSDESPSVKVVLEHISVVI